MMPVVSHSSFLCPFSAMYCRWALMKEVHSVAQTPFNNPLIPQSGAVDPCRVRFQGFKNRPEGSFSKNGLAVLGTSLLGLWTYLA